MSQAVLKRGREVLHKRAFAKPAVSFAKAVGDEPAIVLMTIAGLAASGIAAIVGPFGTIDLPLIPRAVFWVTLIGWNIAKWSAWLALARRLGHARQRASLIGIAVLGAPLPFEIAIAGRLIRADFVLPAGTTIIRAWMIGAILFVTISALAQAVRRAPARAISPPPQPGPPHYIARLQVGADDLVAIRAEDHYCRLYLGNGSQRLMLCRFTDALAAVSALDGCRIHRGTWIAAAAVRGSRREGRQWRLKSALDEEFAVSPSHLAELRRRGWLRRGSAQ